MPKKPPRISASEWIVANLVWEQPKITAAEILERLPANVRWKQKTVNTFLARLAAKGVLGVRKEGKINRYFPKIDREACVEAVSTSFLERIFGGWAAPMLAHFCETAPLSDAEIEELKRILRRRQQGGKRHE
jgi:BlaI family penicillinase repressor